MINLRRDFMLSHWKIELSRWLHFADQHEIVDKFNNMYTEVPKLKYVGICDSVTIHCCGFTKSALYSTQQWISLVVLFALYGLNQFKISKYFFFSLVDDKNYKISLVLAFMLILEAYL